MDHRWDETTEQERVGRAEQDRFGSRRIERDRDVERRDELRRAEHLREINLSPWDIGEAWYDQRDLYTKNAEIDASGYGKGPSYHPLEGSYAYPRDSRPNEWVVDGSHASLYEKEAWPWLVYKDPEADPYFSYLHDDEQRPSFWERAKTFVGRLVGYRSDAERRSDARIRADAADALWYRGDIDVSEIEIKSERGVVTLEGSVPDIRSKHIAGEVIRGVRGVRLVHNHLKVERDDTDDTGIALAPAI